MRGMNALTMVRGFDRIRLSQEGERAMRTMLKVNMSTETANELARQGRLGTVIKSILDDLKPEAAYFTDDNGERTGFIFFDLADASQIPAVAEPSFRPAMNAEDLAKAVPGIDRAVKKYAGRA